MCLVSACVSPPAAVGLRLLTRTNRDRTGVVGWIVSPQQRYAGVLSPGSSGCDLVWRWGLRRGKTRSLGRALIQYDGCPYRKGNRG